MSIFRTRARPGLKLLGTTAALIAALGVAVPAVASHPEESLPGSNFEIDTDANLKVDDPSPSIDWAGVSEIRATDQPTGNTDDSYQGGVKEDTACPGEVTGSIPNNKSDLRTFHAYEEAGGPSNPAGYLNLGWSRVNDPTGTTLMDFEFNQSSTNCATGPNRLRTAGDLLIEYSIDQGGSRATITGRTWTGTAWGSAQTLSNPSPTCGGNPCATGTINTSPIPFGDSDGILTAGSMAPRTFGEAQIDLRLLFQPNKCASFGSAMLKSRSSDSFTSQLKDFIRPVDIDLQNCGNVIIRKQTLPDENPNTSVFGYTKQFNTDPSTPNTFTLMDDGVQNYNNHVLFGSGYTVTEDVLAANYAFDHLDCSASSGVTPSINGATVTFAIDSDSDVLDCTYFNRLELGALKILKNSTKGSAVNNPGAVFSYDGSSVTDNGAGDADPDVGEVCVPGLALGNYTVNETSPPPGYASAGQSNLTATVVSGTNCTNNQPTTGLVTFVNAPLADIQVNFRDGGSGETSATSITCANTGTTPNLTPASGWDDSVTHTGIAIDPSPRTVTCTIVIDP